MKATLLCAALAAVLAPAARSQDNVAVKAGKIVTITGPTIDNGVVLIQNGRIVKVGKQGDIEIPWDSTQSGPRGLRWPYRTLRSPIGATALR